jgi:putative membrane protein
MFSEYGYYMGGMHGFWWFVGLALIVALWFTVLRPGRRNRRKDTETPHEILRRRLARGDITPQAYEQAKALLDRDAPAD